MQTKDMIRAEMRFRRRSASLALRQSAAGSVSRQLLALPAVVKAIGNGSAIAVYIASAHEVDLFEFIEAALSRGANLAAPRWNGGGYEMAKFEGAASLVAGPHGIMEPSPTSMRVKCETVAVWLVPGLAFTTGGDRLGFGGGWYDRLLASADENSVKLGIAYDFQIVGQIPHEPHDLRMDGVIVCR